jgi:trehalose 6-phosphate synthase
MLPVVLLSHRGPATFRRTTSGLTLKRGAGGLVTALMGLAEHLEDAVWVCAASSEADALVAAEHEGHPIEIGFSPELHVVDDDTLGPTLNVRYVEVEREQHEAFYTKIANPLLWFVQHGLYGLATQPEITAEIHDAYADGYVAVNEQFADAVIEEVERLDGKAIVMLHDYHFYLVGERVRQRFPDAVISHFVHIPWPGPDGWRVLPVAMRDGMLRGLLGCDVVAFHTRRSARNFLTCAQEMLDLPVDFRRGTVEVTGEDGRRRTVAARAYPISVDVEAVEKLAASEEVSAHRAALADQHLQDERQLVVRVDRTDPSKNIVRGFRAFGLMLEQHPELLGRVTFLASLMPSRQDVPEYADYLGQVGGVVAEVNARHHAEGWQPVDLRLQEDMAFAVAAYQLADVLVVNAVNDGMNLVAKEAVLANQRDGVLLLSENTGAHEELGDFALTVQPFDLQQQADAIFEALTMERGRRRELLGAASDRVRANDVERWLRNQLDDLERIGA